MNILNSIDNTAQNWIKTPKGTTQNAYKSFCIAFLISGFKGAYNSSTITTSLIKASALNGLFWAATTAMMGVATTVSNKFFPTQKNGAVVDTIRFSLAIGSTAYVAKSYKYPYENVVENIIIFAVNNLYRRGLDDAPKSYTPSLGRNNTTN